MSFDYWHMKMQGGWVHHNGAVKRIDNLSFDDEAWEKDMPKGRFPEDYLPYITFLLSCGTTVSYEEFEVKFPDDQWVMANQQKATCLSRKMSRQYKIAPTDELYSLTYRAPMNVVLDACDSPKYVDPSELFTWTQEDKVFNKRLSCIRTGRAQQLLMYHETPICTLKRGEDWILLQSIVGKLPKEVMSLWGDKLGKEQPAPPDTTLSGADLSALVHVWVKKTTVSGVSRTLYSYYIGEATGDGHYMRFRAGSVTKAYVHSLSDIGLLFLDNLITRGEFADLTSIFNDEIGEQNEDVNTGR